MLNTRFNGVWGVLRCLSDLLKNIFFLISISIIMLDYIFNICFALTWILTLVTLGCLAVSSC